MCDLISRSALLASATKYKYEITSDCHPFEELRIQGKAFRKMVDDAPAVDAVEVVLCKDCKHWNKDALACDTLPWVNSCEHVNWYDNDFCSYGERK